MNEPSFEQAMQDLERILRELEDGSTTLEASLAAYEKGISLIRICQTKLVEADERILQLNGTDAKGKPMITPFDHTPSNEVGHDKVRSAKTRPKEGGLY